MKTHETLLFGSETIQQKNVRPWVKLSKSIWFADVCMRWTHQLSIMNRRGWYIS